MVAKVKTKTRVQHLPPTFSVGNGGKPEVRSRVLEGLHDHRRRAGAEAALDARHPGRRAPHRWCRGAGAQPGDHRHARPARWRRRGIPAVAAQQNSNGRFLAAMDMAIRRPPR